MPSPILRTFRLLWLLALLLCLVPFHTASAGDKSCDVEIAQADRLEPGDDYDPFGGSSLGYNRVELRFRGNGPPCTVVVGIDDGQYGNRMMQHAGERLAYELYKDGSRSQPIGNINGPESGLFKLTLDERNDRAEIQVYIHVPPGQVVRKGPYQDRVVVNAYELRNGTPVGPIATRLVQVRARVREVVDAAVTVNGATRPLSGTSGVLDMGELSRTGGGRFDLTVNGNSDYTLSLSSENAGRLVAPANGGSIDYQVAVQGRTLSLSRGTNIDLGGNGRYQIDVIVGDVSRALAGTYRDNLILTISAR